jgi:uncharacterized oxidoreductase
MTTVAPVTIAPDDLHERLRKIVAATGAPEPIAEEVASHLVRAQRSGHASHGALRMSQYVQEADNGQLVPSAVPTLVSQTQSATVVDGHMGYGHYTAAIATAHAIESARHSGVGVSAMRNTNHIGRLGEYTERVTEAGLVGIMVVGAAGPGVGGMKPFGGHADEPFMNTNPWCIGIPAEPGPVVFDGSMSTIAEGKVHAARDKGEQLPDGAIIDAAGQPSNDPADYYGGGSLLPLGGLVAGHKGAGLALSAALLGGLAFADETAPALRGIGPIRHEDGAEHSLGGITIIAIDPGMLGNREAYAGRVSRTAEALRQTGALVPGDMERQSRESNSSELSLPPATLEGLQSLEERFAL